jgi:hypothetical protein
VRKGDTLWGISERYLDDPWLWPELWQLNPEISNPHLVVIYLSVDYILLGRTISTRA